MKNDVVELNACIFSQPDERDFYVSGEVSNIINRPEKCPAPFDLTDINQFSKEESKYSCVACALSGIRQQLSRLQDVNEEYDYVWLYNQCKLIDELEKGINGTTLKAVLTVAKNIGVKTTTGLYRKIKEYKKIINPNDQTQMETAIFLYHGVLAAVTLSNNGWEGLIVRPPAFGEKTGGHGIIINGYDDIYRAQDSMPSYHNGDLFGIPKTYPINEAWAITVDDVLSISNGITGWIADDIKNTIKEDVLISRLNIRYSPNGNIIKTLAIGTKFISIEKYSFMVGGHTWRKIQII
jgi:hypothetical protein